MDGSPLSPQVLFSIGPVAIDGAVVTTWAIMLLLVACAGWSGRHLQLQPRSWQVALEGIVLTLRDAIDNVAPGYSGQILPFVGTLWVYLVVANLAGLIPGVESPTGELSTTAALALLVFFSVHWFGIRALGLKTYLRHYLSPSPLLLPFHIVSEITRTVALAVRLFGNIMSLEMAALLILLVAGLLVPVPVLMLHVVEALVQAYIFGMLALVYIAGGLELQRAKHVEESKHD
ncbi:MAG: hypothetical protein AMJ69_03120 [Gammaproteobacteria bacterium SG8_47]|nr:MAG: hypothetical protein AMJ69_03120 [Gammaproteobacteria bacterium SG8_47]